MRFLAFLIAIFVAASVEASAITITRNDFLAIANDEINDLESETSQGTAIPTSTTVDAIDGNAHSKNVINWSISGGQTILSYEVDHTRTGTVESNSTSETPSPIEFTANSSEPYELSGFYNVTDVGASGTVIYGCTLYDVTSGNILFENSQGSRNTTNEQFVLGGAGGDFYNEVNGTLTGNVIAGHAYQLVFGFRISTWPNADSGASALGNFTLAIGTQSGDFNDNGIRDAADYVVWRKNSYSPAYHDLWRAHFGEPTAGRGMSTPEPSSVLLWLAAVVATLMRRARSRS
jgi:hypothetical protein